MGRIEACAAGLAQSRGTGDRSDFEREQVAEAIPDALRQDWREEHCDELVREMRGVLGETRQDGALTRP